jgi:hypothetical protein
MSTSTTHLSWQNLEGRVRALASIKWNCAAQSETINGVKCDAILRVKSNHWIAIEISKSTTLEKLRTDLAKFSLIRQFLFSQNIYVECYFVTDTEPTDSMRTAAVNAHVLVHSLNSFQALLLDYEQYFNLRSMKPFGSAVDPESGHKDNTKYITVRYIGDKHDTYYDLKNIMNLLTAGKRIILLGNYGTGKSRCIQELFGMLNTSASQRSLFPLAIDLRDNWGLKRATEMVRRHFADLGLSEMADSAIRVADHGRFIPLIDGFDEIGTQSWSGDTNALQSIRRQSLAGVKDLLTTWKGGALVAGREHYFNSSQEMFDCLGLSEASTIVVRCSDQFTEEELRCYLKEISDLNSMPEWMPRRPLVCQVLKRMDKNVVNTLLANSGGEATFWSTVSNELCEREARINPVLDAQVVKRVLCRLARITRSKKDDIGPLSPTEINDAFHQVTKAPPVGESAVMLQRFMVLGRVGAESADRQFVDTYFLDGLRADDVSNAIYEEYEDLANLDWFNPIQDFGLRLLADEFERSRNPTSLFRVMKRSAGSKNRVLAGECIAAMLLAADDSVNFNNLTLSGAHISRLDLSVGAKNLQIRDSFIDILELTNCEVENVEIDRCEIGYVDGVAQQSGLPLWVMNCKVQSFRNLSTVSRIKYAPITEKQRVFATIIKKTFLQPGSGRKEEALLRGLGKQVSSSDLKHLLNQLCKEGILFQIPGDSGTVFVPNREHTKRMNCILAELTHCKDPLWVKLASE